MSVLILTAKWLATCIAYAFGNYWRKSDIAKDLSHAAASNIAAAFGISLIWFAVWCL